MEFAVAEINSNPSILPGVRLSYRILDSCGRHPWALQGAFSLVGGDSQSCTSTDKPPRPGATGETTERESGGMKLLIAGHVQWQLWFLCTYVDNLFNRAWDAVVGRIPLCYRCDRWSIVDHRHHTV